MTHFCHHIKMQIQLLKQSLWERFNSSLLLRLGGAIGAITLMAFVGMSASWMIAKTTQGNGEAINVAGSLRMQSWRLVSLHQTHVQENTSHSNQQLSNAIQQFQADLNASAISSVLSNSNKSPLDLSYQHIQEEWAQQIKPIVKLHSMQANHLLLTEIPVFVDNIDGLVKQIENITESRILVLRILLGVAIIITTIIVILSVYAIRNILIKPLHELLQLTDRIRQGDLSVRTQFSGEDEIKRLGTAFDLMAADLEKFYQDLEQLVAKKTEELTLSNHSLDLLYRATSRLNIMDAGQDSLQKTLKEAESLLGMRNSLICLHTEDTPWHTQDRMLTVVDTSKQQDSCHNNSCIKCEKTTQITQTTTPTGDYALRIPLRDRKKNHGILVMYMPSSHALEPWKMQLLETLARHISIAISAEKHIEQQRRVALLEERAVIARELHDSLAQSLAYMRIQVTRLKAEIKDKDEQAPVYTILEELREGLVSSYQQLRELLSTFRLKMQEESLFIALEDTINEFSHRASLPIELDIWLNETILSPNEEIHLLHITREALSNIVKHAQAKKAWVRLSKQEDGNILMQIEDNGMGIQQKADLHHYGMKIMEERTKALHGKIDYREGMQGGFLIEVSFTPFHLRNTKPTAITGYA